MRNVVLLAHMVVFLALAVSACSKNSSVFPASMLWTEFFERSIGADCKNGYWFDGVEPGAPAYAEVFAAPTDGVESSDAESSRGRLYIISGRVNEETQEQPRLELLPVREEPRQLVYAELSIKVNRLHRPASPNVILRRLRERRIDAGRVVVSEKVQVLESTWSAVARPDTTKLVSFGGSEDGIVYVKRLDDRIAQPQLSSVYRKNRRGQWEQPTGEWVRYDWSDPELGDDPFDYTLFKTRALSAEWL